MNEEEYKTELLRQIRSININLVEIQTELNKQKKYIDDIKFNVNLIAFILFIPFLIKIIVVVIALFSGAKLYDSIINIVSSIP